MTATESKRINERILQYWQELCRGRPYPMESDFDPYAVEDIWDSCFLVNVENAGQLDGFKYTYLGSSLVEAYGDDLTNREVCERLVYPSSMSLMHTFRKVIESQQPVTEESEFTNTKGMVIKFRSCMLPIGKTGVQGVQYVVGGMKWKAF